MSFCSYVLYGLAPQRQLHTLQLCGCSTPERTSLIFFMAPAAQRYPLTGGYGMGDEGSSPFPRPVLITYQVLNARFSQPTAFYWVDIWLALFVSFYVLAGFGLLRTLS